MTRNTKVALAVAGVLGSAAWVPAVAQTNATIYASGASAQRTFWEKDLGYLCTGSRTMRERRGHIGSTSPDTSTPGSSTTSRSRTC